MFLIASYVIYYRIKYNNKKSTLINYALKIFGLYALLLNTVLTIPFFQIFLATIYCDPADEIHVDMVCYSGIYFLHLIVACIGILLLVAFTLLFTLLYIDLNPNSSIPFAASQSKLSIVKLAIKIMLPLYIVLDFKVAYSIINLNNHFIGKSHTTVCCFIRRYLGDNLILKI